MKKIFIAAFCMLNLMLSCVKNENDIETLGVFNDQISGFEGTVRFKNGKLVNGYPIRLHGGAYGSSISVSQTGNITVDKSPDAAAVETESDDKGRYRVTMKNKDFPLWNVFLATLGIPNPVYEEYVPEYIDVEKSNKTGIGQCEFGKIKKVDIVLHESAQLWLYSSDITVPYDKIRITGIAKTPIDYKDFDFVMEGEQPQVVGSGWGSGRYTKKDEPIELSVSIYKDNKIEIRKMNMPMNQLKNYIIIN